MFSLPSWLTWPSTPDEPSDPGQDHHRILEPPAAPPQWSRTPCHVFLSSSSQAHIGSSPHILGRLVDEDKTITILIDTGAQTSVIARSAVPSSLQVRCIQPLLHKGFSGGTGTLRENVILPLELVGLAKDIATTTAMVLWVPAYVVEDETLGGVDICLGMNVLEPSEAALWLSNGPCLELKDEARSGNARVRLPVWYPPIAVSTSD